MNSYIRLTLLFIILLKVHSFIYLFPIDHDDLNDVNDQEGEFWILI